MLFKEKFNSFEMFVDYIKKNIKHYNIKSPTLKEIYELSKLTEIGKFKTKQLSFIRNYILCLNGGLTTEDFWRTRLWEDPKEELSKYQQKLGMKAVSSGSLKGRFSEKWFLKKYGEDEGLIKYKEHKKMRSEKNKKDEQIKKHGKDHYDDVQVKKLQNLTGFITRYGEKEGLIKFNAFKEKSKSTKENFIKRHGEIEGTKKWETYVERCRYTSSIQYYIDEHGKDEGTRLYQEFLDKSLNIQTSMYSKKSEVLFNDIVTKTGITALCGKNEGTIKVGFKRYKPDFLYGKKIIEFFGDYWHLNPIKYNANDEVKFPNNKIIKPIDKWNEDQKRINTLKSQGFEILIIWENDYMKKYDKVLNECLDFISN